MVSVLLIAQLILRLGFSTPPAAAVAFDVGCSYRHKSMSGPNVEDACARKAIDGTLRLSPRLLSKMKFDKDGLSEISTSDGCYWAHKSGLARKTMCFDNGSDAFAEGLARYKDPNGKMGFMNKKLQIVIAPKYDMAFPFSSGVATAGTSGRLMPEGEHSRYEGGRWKLIDKRGHVVKDCPKAKSHEDCFPEAKDLRK